MNGREVALAAFTDRGMALAEELCRTLGGTVTRIGGQGPSLEAWTRSAFAQERALVFVGAVGIAVRAVAPYLRSKAEDPAVVAVDEGGRFAVPVVSGHLGGANDLARAIGRLCGAVPVITTATDLRGAFAVDEWARRQGCVIPEPEKIKAVSSRVLGGGSIGVFSRWPVEGAPPPGVSLVPESQCQVRLDVGRGEGQALCLVPAAAVLGIGCRRGISCQALEEAFGALCRETGLWPQAVAAAATIDLKAEEPGLLSFCAAHGWPLKVFSPQQLMEAQGDFTASAFVKQVTGADNVCERSAVLTAGGPLWAKKRAGGGVTMAVALRPVPLDWRWKDA